MLICVVKLFYIDFECFVENGYVILGGEWK